MKNVDENQIVRNLGIPDSENGPYVTKLREHIHNQVYFGGLKYISPGTWAKHPDSYEERAKAILAFLWAGDNLSYKVECMDRIIYVQTDYATKKKKLIIEWKYIPAKIRDLCRKFIFKIKKPFLPKNPYS